MYKQLATALEKDGMLTKQIRSQYFNGCDFTVVRKRLGEMGFDPHTCLELESTEIALVTPKGILMQKRNYDQKGLYTLGLWGGVLNCDETPEEGATRELKEETGLDITVTKENFVEIDTHHHEYANGDKVLFHTHRYKVVIDYVPEIQLDEESAGMQFVRALVLDHQRGFVKNVLMESTINP